MVNISGTHAVKHSEAAGLTDIGMVRDNNEDAFLCDRERGLYVVCDGMGGMAAGEVASRMSIDAIDAYVTPERIADAFAVGKDGLRTLIVSSLIQAQADLDAYVAEHPDLEGMGSTAVVGIVGPNTAYIGNLGDSRAYLLRDRDPHILTVDHSLGAVLIGLGEMSEEDVAALGLRNQLIGALGAAYREPAFTSELFVRGDRLLLCSDGLWDVIDADGISRIVTDATSPAAAVATLISAARQGGGPDNITAIVVQRPR